MIVNQNHGATSQTIFHKRTRRGKLLRVTNESYPRNDCGMGYFHGSLLDTDCFLSLTQEKDVKEIIVIDTNIVIHHIDALENASLENVMIVICQTVLSESRKLNTSIFKRLTALIGDRNKLFLFYPNELSIDTMQSRDPNEKINDYNDRLIFSVAYFLKNVLNGKTSLPVLLVTNDSANKERGIHAGLQCATFREYILNSFGANHPLSDLLTAPITISKETPAIFKPHLNEDSIQKGIRDGSLMKGIVRVKGTHWEDCYVSGHVNGSKKRRFVDVHGSLNVNRAVDGDMVVVKQMEAVSIKTQETLQACDVECIAVDDTETVVTGEIVAIIKRCNTTLCGSLVTNPPDCPFSEAHTFALFSPTSKKFPDIWICSTRLPDLVGKRIVVTIDSWPDYSAFPIGHCVKILGNIGDPEVETQILLSEYGVASEDFSTEVMACLPAKDWAISEVDLVGRTDFRSIPVVSIDPPGCKDIDDALHCISLPNGRFQVGVHIADVTHFVQPGTPLDKEAARRSTSTYLVERRLDMLPSILTTQLCSLRSNEDHLSFSVVWEMDENANIYDVSFSKSVIRSVASLTYDAAQVMIDNNDPKSSPVDSSVIMLNKLAKILKKNRIEQGALTLASPEVKFKLDMETMNPTDVAIYAHKEANSLVEEFMLLANITVAKKTLKHFPTLSILRRHQPPSIEQFRPLLIAASVSGFSLDVSNSRALADSLDAAVRPDDPFFNKLLRMLSTRCMMPAQYFCSGEIPKDQWHHYGLATHVYTHFTSPIRRYADVLVHRLLAASIGVAPLPTINSSRSLQQEQSTHMNRRHKAAQYAQRASIQLYTHIFFRGKTSIEEGYVTSVTSDYINIFIPKYGIENSMSVSSISEVLGADRTQFFDDRLTIEFFENQSKVGSICIFEKVSIELKGAASMEEKDGVTLRWLKNGS